MKIPSTIVRPAWWTGVVKAGSLMRRRLLLLIAWLLGLTLIYVLTTPGPRRGWQPPLNHQYAGLLSDDCTMLTVMRSPSAMSSQCTGPIRLWDVATGELVAEHFGSEDRFE